MAPSELVGLTGGIASGKSTVTEHLRKMGPSIAVIDADALYHELIAPRHGAPSALAKEIDAQLGAGRSLLGPDGALARPRLARIVFEQPERRKALEALTHPAVRSLASERIAEAKSHGAQVVFYDVPLLFESGIEKDFWGVVLVWVPKEVQLQRLMARNRFSQAEATARIDAQKPLDEKRDLARWVVDNSGTKQAAYRQIDAIVREILGE